MHSLIPMPSTPPVFDHLQYAKIDQNWWCRRPACRVGHILLKPPIILFLNSAMLNIYIHIVINTYIHIIILRAIILHTSQY